MGSSSNDGGDECLITFLEIDSRRRVGPQAVISLSYLQGTLGRGNCQLCAPRVSGLRLWLTRHEEGKQQVTP